MSIKSKVRAQSRAKVKESTQERGEEVKNEMAEDEERHKGNLIIATVGVSLVLSVLLVLAVLWNQPRYRVDNHGQYVDFTAVESEGGEYLGPLMNSLYKGKGDFQYLSGGKYTGSFANSKRQGEGCFEWPNGDRFDGTWNGDRMIEGTYTFADGSEYSGTFSNVSEKRKIDTGIFTLNCKKEHDEYETFCARFEEGQVVSVGFERDDGLTYHGALTGSAEITYPSGNRYSGDVSEGIKSGEGDFYWIEHGAVVGKYSGGWEKDQMNGFGTYYYTDDSYPRLYGTFEDGNPVGTATYLNENYEKFSTEWSNGVCISAEEE